MKLIPTFAAMMFSLLANAQLNGTYTVGGGSPDYASLTAAVNDLMSEGASGNVTFDIRPGTHTGQYALGDIPGTPGNITFRNSTNGAQVVDLRWDATSPEDNFIFVVDGTDGVRFENLTFRTLDEYYARAIRFFNACENFQVEQCTFHGSYSADGPGHLYKIAIHCDQLNVNSSDNPQDVSIMGNSFFGGYTGVDMYFHPGGGGRSEGLLISGNEFIDQHGTGITVTNAVGQINDNLFRTTVALGYTGIRTSTFDRGSQIARNIIDAVTPFDCTGIEVSNTQSTTGNTVINNMVHVGGSTATWGIAVFNLWGVTIAHNSVLVSEGGGEGSHAFYHLSSFADGQDALVRNNIFANHGGGTAYTVNVMGNVGIEDHNDLFSSGPVLARIGATEYADLAAYQAGTGMGDGDVNTDPVFPAQPDLHRYGCGPDNEGLYMPEVVADIDGQMRDTPACDIGADEYDAGPGVEAVQAPTISIYGTELPYALGLNAAFDTYQWSTGATTPTISIVAGGDYECLVQDVNGCLYEVGITVEVDFSTGTNGKAPLVPVLFPNPANGSIQVSGSLQGSAYLILDMSGRVVDRGAVFNDRLDISALTSGAYVLRSVGSDGPRSDRFVVQ
jgi:hypothetical protein